MRQLTVLAAAITRGFGCAFEQVCNSTYINHLKSSMLQRLHTVGLHSQSVECRIVGWLMAKK